MAYMSVREMIALHHPEYLNTEEYPTDKVAAIVKTTDEWGVFGNFYKYPAKAGKRQPIVTLNGVEFDCTERLFQLMKVTDKECLLLINAKPCGICFKRQMAKILKEHGKEWRSDWQDIIIDAMKFCLQKKYEQCKEFRDKLFIQTMGSKGIRFSLRGGEWQTVAPVPNDNVVDTEGAGDWTTAQFIACLCDKNLLSLDKMNDTNVRECLEKACATASRSVSYLSSKGMIDAEKGWDKEPASSSVKCDKVPTTGIIGAICGDILGSKYELHSFRTKRYDFKLFPKGSHFTDDTVLTLAVARWLMGGERTDKALVDSMLELGRFYPDAGYGRGFKTWLKSDVQEPYGAASNGSAMRVSAVGWVCDTLGETLRLARQSAAVSHNSVGGEHGAMSVAAAIFLARTGHSKEEIKSYIEKEFGYDLNRQVDAIRQNYKFEILCEKSVPEAIICWLQSDTYEQTVRNAISLGGDADTQAAIAGAIAAATPGMAVPQDIADTSFSMLTDELKEIVIAFQNSLDLQ